MARQKTLQFNPVKNSGLLSSHWLEHRLQLEPEWTECEQQARAALADLSRLWAGQRIRVKQYGDEAGLEQAFIQPVLEALGWKLKYQTYLQGRKPDYALFLTDESLDRALKAGRNSPDFWKHPTVVADAKAWHVSLDRPTEIDSQREFPPQQIEWYLDRSHLDHGILTNGRLWRLVPRQYTPQQRRFQTYLECDLPELLNARQLLIEDFLEFYLFFSPVAFAERDGRKSLIVRAIEGSSEYRLGVGESLKQRAFKALELCIEGLLTFGPNGLNPQEHLELSREQSFVLLYRILFIMFAEDRQLLPYRVNLTYTKNRSMGRHRDDIGSQLDRAKDHESGDYSRDSTALWADLQALFDLVDAGHKTYGVPAYNGGLFDPDEHPFLAEKQIPDYYLARIIDQLSRASDPEAPNLGLFRVDYRDLAIQHLGSIYEGLLELHPHHASDRMVVVSRRVQGRMEEQVLSESAKVPKGFTLTDMSYRKGTIYLRTNKGERRASGSYYTPDHIVDHIVQGVLGPLCKRVSENLKRDVQEAESLGDTSRLNELRREFDDRILQLRVLDPAMGSGHFLIRACQFLAEEIATHPFAGDSALAEASDGESALSFWKRRVAECCLYGVDLNSLAVELAKLALWLETVAINRPLTFLDHHLRTGNSLIGGKLTELGALPHEIELRASVVAQQVENQLPVLLKPLAEIRQTPSETLEQIKAKQRLYKTYDKAHEPFTIVADLWASTFVDPALTDEQYQQAIDAVAQPRKFAQLSSEQWFVKAILKAKRPDFRPFHWELEFLEAYYSGDGRRPDAGFDAIIGNPPYEVLSELESGSDLTAFRAFIDHEPQYEPSKRGKNNLYKLFICRALNLLTDGGYFGFITPMPLLGDDQACGVRQEIIRTARFKSIDAFPQKDNPHNRVFPEAKLSTVVFTIVKEQSNPEPFRVRVHAGREFSNDSPSLNLTTGEIPLYDPTNLAIVSCGQGDWDLATRIMQTGRLDRLGKFCTSYQGEVNETNEKGHGSLSQWPADGPLILRGANLCLYAIRSASQGESLYLREAVFLNGKSSDSKAFHGRQQRAGFQRSSPQNNFRRIVASIIAPNNFCFDTISYVPANDTQLPLSFLVALLNSKLLDWYFRLGSTNSKVNEYQFNNLPCPVFATVVDRDEFVCSNVIQAIRKNNLEHAFALLQPELVNAPYPFGVCNVISAVADRIAQIEFERGEIARTARSALDEQAQPYQDFIDKLFYTMAGLTDAGARGLEQRLATMQ